MAERVELGGVPETLLWTLWHRAVEARRPDGVLRDPKAVELVAAIDYPFAERFGERPAVAQWQALRVLRFDVEVRRFLAAHPGGTVVALGEGLETQFWRVDDGRVRWLTVDLPETVAVRERLLARGDRQTVHAGSALDRAWMDAVPGGAPVLLTAQGLLMYFEFDAVLRLLDALGERFRGSAFVFDTVPRGLSDASRKGRLGRPGGYRPPPWPWGLDRPHYRALAARVGALDRLALPRGRGVLRYLAPVLPRTILRARL